MPKAETRDFNIAIVSDLHFRQDKDGNWKNHRISPEQFETIFEQADILCVCGDWTHRADQEQAKQAAATFRDSPIPIVGVVGNHDRNKKNPPLVENILSEEGGITILNGDVFPLAIDDEHILEITGVPGYSHYVSRAKLGPHKVSPEKFDEMIETDLENLKNGIQNLNGSINVVLLHFPPIESYYPTTTVPKKDLTIPKLIAKNKKKIDIVAFGDVHSDPQPELIDPVFQFSTINVAQKPIFINVSAHDPVITAL